MPKSKKVEKKPAPAVKTRRTDGPAVKATARQTAKQTFKQTVKQTFKQTVKSIDRPTAKETVKPVKKSAKSAPPSAVVEPPASAQAPTKFRREYKRWKDLLISLRHRLLQEGSHLEEEGLKALEQEVSVDHMADYGSDSSEQETTLQLIESNSLSLRDVDDALKRIEVGSYGLCEECETLIPAARLGVLPHARLCIGCQSKREGMPA